MYFAFEKNTGAINGFYAHEEDCIASTEYLVEQYPGTNWVIGKAIKKMGTGDKTLRRTYTTDLQMQKKLRDFSDWYEAWNGSPHYI